jgi:hypothetical protein
MKNNGSEQQWLKTLGLFSQIVSDLVVTIGIGLGLGYLAWKKWNAPRWVPLLTGLVSIVVAFYRLIQLAEKRTDES